MGECFKAGALTRAVGTALGLQFIRSANIGDTFDDTTEVSVTFLATAEQMRQIGEAMSADGRKPAGPENQSFSLSGKATK